MSDYKNYERYLRGEYRVDGWKSDWRIVQEARRPKPTPISVIAHHGKTITTKVSRPYVRPVITPERRAAHNASVRRSLQKKRMKAKKEGVCVDCFREPSIEAHTLCDPCRLDRSTRERNKRLKKAA